MGIIFDMYNYDESVTDEQVKIIDDFFDSLQIKWLSNSKPVMDVTSVPYGQLMNMVETDHRWIYKGSLTTPPCTELIYWNVVAKVYPIKPRHVEAFENLIWKEAAKNNAWIKQGGNYRVIQELKK